MDGTHIADVEDSWIASSPVIVSLYVVTVALVSLSEKCLSPTAETAIEINAERLIGM
jgi:hypothetical protein